VSAATRPSDRETQMGSLFTVRCESCHGSASETCAGAGYPQATDLEIGSNRCELARCELEPLLGCYPYGGRESAHDRGVWPRV